MKDNEQDESINNIQLAIKELGDDLNVLHDTAFDALNAHEVAIKELGKQNEVQSEILTKHLERLDEMEKQNMDALKWIVHERDDILKNHAGRITRLEELERHYTVGDKSMQMDMGESKDNEPQNSSDELYEKIKKDHGDRTRIGSGDDQFYVDQLSEYMDKQKPFWIQIFDEILKQGKLAEREKIKEIAKRKIQEHYEKHIKGHDANNWLCIPNVFDEVFAELEKEMK